jgi:glutamate dehydrogenase/leucine dehydrogenase
MKIVVIGGTGLIGSKTVAILRQGGHEVVAASPRSGINTITGEGLKEALKAIGDPRKVVSDPEARYWGGRVEERSLVPLNEARLGRIGLDEWLRRSQARA